MPEKIELKHQAVAGTLESSDVQIMIDQADQLDIELTSAVMHQYGRRIQEVVHEVLEKFGIDRAKIIIDDRGALDCTIRARLEAAIYRAADQQQEVHWEELQQWND